MPAITEPLAGEHMLQDPSGAARELAGGATALADALVATPGAPSRARAEASASQPTLTDASGASDRPSNGPPAAANRLPRPTPFRSAADLAAQALAHVGVDPGAALRAADTAILLAQSATVPNHAAAATAHRAAALALREMAEVPRAETRARAAVRAAAKAGSARHEAEGRMTLAFILLERGKIRAAHGHAHRAAASVTGVVAARIGAQRALILQRSGRFDTALDEYQAALPVLRRHRDRSWEAKLLNNRGTLHLDRGDLAAASTDLEAARRLHAATGKSLLAADAEWNLGLVAARRGDVPAALRNFDRVEQEYTVRGTPNPQLLIDRAEVLLSVGLWTEARAVAERAVAALGDSGQEADLAHARLTLASALLTAGQMDSARLQATAARQLFAAQGRKTWAVFCDLVAIRAAEASTAESSALLAEAEQCIAAAATAGWRLAEVEASVLAARIAARAGALDASRRHLARATATSDGGSLECRLRISHARALLSNAEGNTRGALAALRSGMRLLESYRSLLGATELRAHVSAIGTDVLALGLELAIDAGDPRRILRWADRSRAKATRARLVRPPRSDELSSALADVRRLQAQWTRAELDGKPAPTLAEQRDAERAVVTASRREPGSPAAVAPDPKIDAIVAACSTTTLIEFVEHNQQLLRIVVRDGRCRFDRLGQVADHASLIDQAQFLLRRLATGFGSATSSGRHVTALRDIGAKLERALLPSAVVDGTGELVLVPSGRLLSLPWAILPSLHDRPFRIAPSAAAWLHASRTPPAAPDARQVFVAGPGLLSAESEVRMAASGGPATVLVGRDATTALVLPALEGAGVAHIAAHGRLRVDNPMFSALRLADGPLTVYDLEDLRVAPRLVVLPACESGVSTATAGTELLGLAAALLSLGSRSVIATGIATPDAATATLMARLHENLRVGAEPAAALAAARAASPDDDPAEYAAGAGFLCFGA